MLSKKRTKASKMRGSSSHGGGHKKKRRGAGNRGGKGFSGTGTRGDQRKTSVLTEAKSFFNQLSASKGVKVSKIKKKYQHFGKKGFKSIKPTNKVLSLNYIEINFDNLVEKKIITKQKDEYVFDSVAFGYDKILGRGILSKKITIICNDISQIAKQRVEEMGGKVIILKEKKTKEDKS
ncbi:MAG: uL15 family ribosomal protein [Nanoarchaeota archaeon]